MAQTSPSNEPKTPGLNNEKILVIERLARIIFGGLIGLSLTWVFAAVILNALPAALNNSIGVNSELLNTLLNLVAYALGAVTGYFFGRNSSKAH
jgi:hypothetical protein